MPPAAQGKFAGSTSIAGWPSPPPAWQLDRPYPAGGVNECYVGKAHKTQHLPQVSDLQVDASRSSFGCISTTTRPRTDSIAEAGRCYLGSPPVSDVSSALSKMSAQRRLSSWHSLSLSLPSSTVPVSSICG